MIATGGLLRMHRRQDSLRSKNRAENKRKRKAKKKKKKTDVVVVKGKLNLCSPAGLVAAVGVIILIVGISMAVLGYWPSSNPHGYQYRSSGSHQAKRTSGSKSQSHPSNLTSDKVVTGKTKVYNQSHANSSSAGPTPHCGFLCDFLDNYLYSDNLKVFGPLVMGIGIFLFICANAVLHENRDKKTKIINLRDIYSTVIDLHSIKSKEYSPLNGLVNYTQSRSADGPSSSRAAPGLHTRSSWPSTGHGFPGELGGDEPARRPSLADRPRSWSRDVQTFTDTVYSIYKDCNSSQQTAKPKQWETTSIVTSSVNAFTLPVIKLNNCDVQESDRGEVRGRTQEGIVVEAAAENSEGGHSEETDTKQKDTSTADQHEDIPADTADQQGAPQAQQQPQWSSPVKLFPPSPVAREMGSRLSLNSLTDQPRSARRCSLSVSACRQGDRTRRFSCPRLEHSSSKGYIKLNDLTGESFDTADTDPPSATPEHEETMDTVAEGVAQGEEDQLAPDTAAES
ncbi:transmembrane protein 200C [Thalassophryne amazonica]|uniref:transmembrane protein 200C n=1 Tax=Thalassophryne amazonica TaxID=390379 RepID=UPI00147200CE|nr:transmembrane protein 200C [Thalassophryne amazonica]